MPTLDGDSPNAEPDVGLLATHYGGKAPLSERFRRAQLRAQMFGDPGEALKVGRYEITGSIGAGAMGAVYRATDSTLEREVALKVLHRSDETHRARMTIEAKALAKLSHPNVVTVHEVGTEDEQLFVAMEFVRGKTLGTWLESPSGPSIMDAFIQAAEGLQAAHDAGIVHRDFKPENVIIGDDGRVRVLDFGMARTPGAPLLEEVDGEAAQQQALEPAITRTGLLAGTPSYMAPEQFEGARVDAKADQFAFCVALHEAVWGVRPFRGETVAELAGSVLRGKATLFEGSPRDDLEAHEVDAIKAVIERGLSTRPNQRFESMRAMTERLRGVPAIERPPLAQYRRNLALGVVSFMLAGVGVSQLSSWLREDPVRIVASSDERLDDARAEAPRSTEVAAAAARAAAAEQARRKPAEVRCGLGTELRDGACVPLAWDPDQVDCTDGDCSVDRAILVGTEEQPAVVLRQLRLVPSVKDGTQIGFKVFGVRTDTAAHIVGLRTGDLVLSINDISLATDVADLVPALTAEVRSAKELKLALQRGGEPQTLVINLRD